MGMVVVSGASCVCNFGTSSGNLTVTSQMQSMADGKPMATTSDNSNSNITPFGMCNSPTNPQVIAATAAALGVFTPQPCQMSSAGSWIPSQTAVTAGGKPVLTNDCSCKCAFGGEIKVSSPGQTKVTIG